MNTGQLTSWIRRFGLMHLLDQLRYRYQYLRNYSANRHFKKAHPEIAMPPDYLMYESFQLHYAKYYQGGRDVALWIKQQLEDFGTLEGMAILDWGCGPGRVVRHLPEVIGPQCSYFGTDYNARSIEWCKRHLAGIQFTINQLQPPLPFASAFFGGVYGISIFTHLSEENHIQWLDDLARVMAPEGLLLLTTHGEVFKAIMTPEENRQFDAGQLVVRSKAREGHRVFTAFQPSRFFNAIVAPSFEVLRHTPGTVRSWGMEQDVWILRKK